MFFYLGVVFVNARKESLGRSLFISPFLDRKSGFLAGCERAVDKERIIWYNYNR